jgi:hypothetical protein
MRLLMFVVFAVALVVRTRRPFFSSRPGTTLLALTLGPDRACVGIVAELALILAIDYTAAGNTTFGTAPIGASVWLFIVPFAAAMLVCEEARKAIVRWDDRRSAA